MNSVAYAIETLYVEQNDFAQLAVRKLIRSSSGLLLAANGSDEDSAFAVVNLTGHPVERFNTANPVTRFGFIMPNESDIEAMQQTGLQTQLLFASDYIELADQIITALNWGYRHIRSTNGCQVIAALVGDPKTDPRGAGIVVDVSTRWTNDELSVPINFDEELFRLLDGETPPH